MIFFRAQCCRISALSVCLLHFRVALPVDSHCHCCLYTCVVVCSCAQAVMPNGKIETITLSSYKGKWVVLLFYPLDFTFVCPTEILAFSDRSDELKAINTEVLAISVDSKWTVRCPHSPPASAHCSSVVSTLDRCPICLTSHVIHFWGVRTGLSHATVPRCSHFVLLSNHACVSSLYRSLSHT